MSGPELDLVGCCLGGNSRYRVTDRIAEGGCSEVFKARDTFSHDPSDSYVALKCWLPQKQGQLTPGALSALAAKARNEYDALRALPRHRHVIAATDRGFGKDRRGHKFSFYVMELASTNLKEYLEREALTLEHINDILRQIYEGLKHLHFNEFIHCDLKPHNILLVGNDCWKICDLGALRRNDSSLTNYPQSTRSYSAPEVMAGEKVTPKSDTYSLAKIGYFLLTGSPPPQGTITDLPIPGTQRSALLNVLRCATASEPDKRFNLETFMSRFDDVASQTREQASRRAGSMRRTLFNRLGAGALLAALLLLGIVMLVPPVTQLPTEVRVSDLAPNLKERFAITDANVHLLKKPGGAVLCTLPSGGRVRMTGNNVNNMFEVEVAQTANKTKKPCLVKQRGWVHGTTFVLVG